MSFTRQSKDFTEWQKRLPEVSEDIKKRNHYRYEYLKLKHQLNKFEL